jgi:hypothetical protein
MNADEEAQTFQLQFQFALQVHHPERFAVCQFVEIIISTSIMQGWHLPSILGNFHVPVVF